MKKYYDWIYSMNIYTVGMWWSLVWVLAGIASWIYTGTLDGEPRLFFALAIGSFVTVLIQKEHVWSKNKYNEEKILKEQEN